MAKPTFNLEMFKAGQAKAAERKFADVEKGVYNCEIVKCWLDHSKKGRLQACFDFQIDENDGQFANSHFWNYIGLSDNDGNQSEKGYEVLGVILNILQADTSSGDPDKILESVIGTKVRVSYDPGDDEKYSSCRVKKVLAKPDGSQPASNYGSDRTDELDQVEAEAEAPQADVQPGDICILTTGQRIVLMAFQDTNETEDGKQYILGYPEGKGMAQATRFSAELVCGVEKATPANTTVEKPAPQSQPQPTAQPAQKPTASDLDDLDGGLEEEEEEEEEETAEWVPSVGDMVTGVSAATGQTHTGPIKAIEDGFIKVSADGKVRKLKPETVQRA